MATTIPDGVERSRARIAGDRVARRLSLTGDEARYCIAYLRFRAGIRAHPPQRWDYLPTTTRIARVVLLEREMGDYVALLRAGEDEVIA